MLIFEQQIYIKNCIRLFIYTIMAQLYYFVGKHNKRVLKLKLMNLKSRTILKIHGKFDIKKKKFKSPIWPYSRLKWRSNCNIKNRNK